VPNGTPAEKVTTVRFKTNPACDKKQWDPITSFGLGLPSNINPDWITKSNIVSGTPQTIEDSVLNGTNLLAYGM
jgi:hypothetical protein